MVIELAGNDDAITTAVAAARPGARVALGGIPSEPRSSFPAATARRKGLTFTMVRRMHGTYGRAIELATSGLDLDRLVTARSALVDAADALANAAERTGDKTVVTASSSGSVLCRAGADVAASPHQKRTLRMMTRTAATAASLLACWYHGSAPSAASWKSFRRGQ